MWSIVFPRVFSQSHSKSSTFLVKNPKLVSSPGMLGPWILRRIYLSSRNSNSSFYWESFTSSWFETINTTKSCWDSNWSSRVRTNSEGWSFSCNLRALSSWRSTRNAFGVEWIFRFSINSVRTFDSQKSLWNICVSVSNTSLLLK